MCTDDAIPSTKDSFQHHLALENLVTASRSALDNEDTLRKHACEFCGVRVRNAENVKHTTNGLFSCQKCSEKIQGSSDIASAPRINLNLSPIHPMYLRTCEICGYEPKTKNKTRERQDHLATKHYGARMKKDLNLNNKSVFANDYRCPICDYACTDRTSLCRHYTRRHKVLEKYLAEDIATGKVVPLVRRDRVQTAGKVPEVTIKTPPIITLEDASVGVISKVKSPGNFMCGTCKKVFSSNALLEEHVSIHFKNRPYQCKDCSVAFLTPGFLRRHQMSEGHINKVKNKDTNDETGVKKYSCIVCNFHTHNITTYIIHMRQEHGIKSIKERADQHFHDNQQFKCKICYRSFANKHVLQTHQRTHTGEKPFQCQVCQKRFSRGHHLKIHMRLHTGEKPFRCSHCGKAFAQEGNLRTHLLVHASCKSSSSSNQQRAQVLEQETGSTVIISNSNVSSLTERLCESTVKKNVTINSSSTMHQEQAQRHGAAPVIQLSLEQIE